MESIHTENYDEDNGEESSDSEYVNISNVHKRRCMPFSLSSSDEDGSETEEHHTEISVGGTIWKKIKEGGVSGRPPIQNIFKVIPSPTAHAKRNIMNGVKRSAFSLLIDTCILELVQS